jgi:hypothetical protein
VEAAQLDKARKKLRLAEALFLRTFFYHLLWTHYGGVPLITKLIDRFTQGDEIYMARNTDLETWQFIIDELPAISLFPDGETKFYEQNNNNEEVIYDSHYLVGSSKIGACREGLQGLWFICGNQKAWEGVDQRSEQYLGL